MKKLLHIVFIISIALILGACSHKPNTTLSYKSNKTLSYRQETTPSDPSPLEFEPLEFSSVDELKQSVNDVLLSRKSEFTENYSHLISMYNFKDLTAYYEPAFLPETAKLKGIYIKDRYVAVYYTLDDTDITFESETDSAIHAIKNIYLLEWNRYENGQQLLDNTIKQQNLKPLDGFNGRYYFDIYNKPEELLAKQIYWVQDGYMFSMHVPMSVYLEHSKELIKDAVRINLK